MDDNHIAAQQIVAARSGFDGSPSMFLHNSCVSIQSVCDLTFNPRLLRLRWIVGLSTAEGLIASRKFARRRLGVVFEFGSLIIGVRDHVEQSLKQDKVTVISS